MSRERIGILDKIWDAVLHEEEEEEKEEKGKSCVRYIMTCAIETRGETTITK
jgi:hypothetical protein